MHTFLIIIQLLIAAGIIGLVLLQQGKGADMGAAFGSGASGTVFGARGSANFLTRTTAILAVLFFANSLVLAYLVGGERDDEPSVIQRAPEPVETEPALPALPALPEAPDAAQ